MQICLCWLYVVAFATHNTINLTIWTSDFEFDPKYHFLISTVHHNSKDCIPVPNSIISPR